MMLLRPIHIHLTPTSFERHQGNKLISRIEYNDIIAICLGKRIAISRHLSHGYDLSLSGQFYRFVPHSVNRTTEQIDYTAVRDLAQRERPKVIVAGRSAYP
jgi:glycine/serine hydroxymethyltransferase